MPDEDLDQDQQEEDTLEATWWLFDQEPGMDDLMKQAGDSLKEMFKNLEIQPFQDSEGGDRLFLARYEFPKYQAAFQHPDGIFLDNPGEVYGFIDFLGGFPLECCEMLVMIGEISSSPAEVQVAQGQDYAAPPVPKEFFEGYEQDKILLNYLFLASENVQWMAENLVGEAAPTKLHWWLRLNIQGENNKYPVPGEFLALGVRLMPDLPWGQQKTSPFLYAGNWMDTVFYTSAMITEVIDPTDDVPYPTYKVQWRKFQATAKPSDFAEYQVGNRVTILKDVAVEKQSQRWKDEDMDTFDGEKWMIAPINFYGLKEKDEEE